MKFLNESNVKYLFLSVCGNMQESSYDSGKIKSFDDDAKKGVKKSKSFTGEPKRKKKGSKSNITERSMKRSATSFDGGLIAVEPDVLTDPHASKISGSNKKFHKRFKLSEEVVIEKFICALLLKGSLLAQGTMYITQNYVCFYTNIFGKKRVMVPFAEIISVRKCKILKSIPNSIEIRTLKKKYFWASFLHRENAFQLIDTRWRFIRKKIGAPIIDASDNTIEWSVDSQTDFGLDWKDELNDDKNQDPLEDDVNTKSIEPKTVIYLSYCFIFI